MNDNSNELKKIVKEHSEKLAKLGIELAKNQFSYKVENKPSKEYWENRIDDFNKYNEKGMKYYNEIHSLMNIINREESQMFLLRISKFRQMGIVFMEIMNKIKENPTIMDSKNKQQSQWSKKIKDEIVEQSKKCLDFEMDMNSAFREFYDKKIKEILEK